MKIPRNGSHWVRESFDKAPKISATKWWYPLNVIKAMQLAKGNEMKKIICKLQIFYLQNRGYYQG